MRSSPEVTTVEICVFPPPSVFLWGMKSYPEITMLDCFVSSPTLSLFFFEGLRSSPRITIVENAAAPPPEFFVFLGG